MGRTLICLRNMLVCAALTFTAACATSGLTEKFRDPNMDFGSIHTVAVMPLVNLSKDQLGAERVRDVLITALLASGGVYALPPGEVWRGIGQSGIATPTTPTPAEAVKVATAVKADAVIVGVLREYGDIRSGTASANVISLSLEMMEGQTGRTVWSASTTRGGVNLKDRLLGGGGRPMNDITEDAIKDLLNLLYE